MTNIDMASMSTDTRERFLELRGLEAMEQLTPFEQEELQQLRREFGISL